MSLDVRASGEAGGGGRSLDEGEEHAGLERVRALDPTSSGLQPKGLDKR